MCFSTLASLSQPYLIKLAIDHNLVPGTLEGFSRYVILFVFAVTGGMLFGYIQVVAVQTLGQRVILQIRKEVFSKLMELPVVYFDSNPAGRIITRVTSDIEAMNEMISAGLVSVMGDILLILSISVILLLLSKVLFLVTLITIALLFVFVQVMKGPMREANRGMRRNTASMNSFLQEYISGIGIVKSFTKEEAVKEKFDEKNLSYREEAIRLSTFYSLYFPGVEFIAALALILILWRGGEGLLVGSVTLGTVIAFVGYLEKFFGPVKDMSDKFNVLQSALASCERVFAILDMEPSQEFSSRGGGKGKHFSPREERKNMILEARDVTFDYGGEGVLENFTLSLKEGERVAIVGPTGAGKSTIANLFLRFYEPSNGSIFYRGRDIRSYPVEEVRKKIILIPQDPFLFQGSILDNILAGEEYDKNRLELALSGCGILKFINRFPEGVHTSVGERGSGLSAGQRQLVSFARALYREPEVFVLDEATAHVDPETEHEVTTAIRRITTGQSSLIIAHRLQTVVECDRIAVVVSGKVVEEGDHQDLIDRGGVYRTLYDLQSTS